MKLHPEVELEQEIKEHSCELNCGGSYCDEKQQNNCDTYQKRIELSAKLESMTHSRLVIKSMPKVKPFTTGRDYEKAILIQQEEIEIEVL